MNAATSNDCLISNVCCYRIINDLAIITSLYECGYNGFLLNNKSSSNSRDLCQKMTYVFRDSKFEQTHVNDEVTSIQRSLIDDISELLYLNFKLNSLPLCTTSESSISAQTTNELLGLAVNKLSDDADKYCSVISQLNELPISEAITADDLGKLDENLRQILLSGIKSSLNEHCLSSVVMLQKLSDRLSKKAADQLRNYASNNKKSVKSGKLLKKFGHGLQAYISCLACDLDFSDSRQLEQCLSRISQAMGGSNVTGRVYKPPKGTVDQTPDAMIIREFLIGKLRSAFKQFGGVEIDTPVFELKEVLTSKYGEDSKLIYDLKDQGGEQLALRYDLTVPFARYCATHGVEKIKRFQIGKVYRRDEPQINAGRFREFVQCDFDITGESEFGILEAEIISLLQYVFSDLENMIGKTLIKLNDRRLLDAILTVCGIEESNHRTVCSSIDKLDKIGWDGVKKELIGEKNISHDTVNKLKPFLTITGDPTDVLKQLRSNSELMKLANANESVNRLDYLCSICDMTNVVLDISLARGLDYYTGLIYEVVPVGCSIPMGSLAAGGSYDKLIGMFCNKNINSIGLSFGFERLYTLLKLYFYNEKNCSLLESKQTVYITTLGSVPPKIRVGLANSLRREGFVVQYSFKQKTNLKKELIAAINMNYYALIIIGASELAENLFRIKFLKLNEEVTVPRANIVSALRNGPSNNDPNGSVNQ